ncbi:hypothetical protein CsSME_00017349 [Camellia sinensis var. sinensis]
MAESVSYQRLLCKWIDMFDHNSRKGRLNQEHAMMTLWFCFSHQAKILSQTITRQQYHFVCVKLLWLIRLIYHKRKPLGLLPRQPLRLATKSLDLQGCWDFSKDPVVELDWSLVYGLCRAKSAIAALNCSGVVLGSLPIRIRNQDEMKPL